MKIWSALFLCLAFLSCKNDDRPALDNAGEKKSGDSLLVTRESWGPITAESTLDDLKKFYGDQVVADSLIMGPEGMDTLRVTYLLPGLPAELIVGGHRVGQRFLLRQQFEGVDDAGGDEIEQVRDVLAVMAVAHADGEVLVHRLAEREILHRRRIDADDGQRAGLGEGLDGPRERL